MSFTNIIGQEKVLKILSNTIKSNKIPHAYIFAGNSSIGKKKTAVEFAKILNCLSPIDQITACENCRNCKKISSNNHPEIKIYNSENKNISIDEIKSIQKDIQYKNAESKYRLVIIDNADKFSQESANCFLKTLEEPPFSTIIILLVNSVSSLLKTIISRCQIIKFKNLTDDEKINILQKSTTKDLAEINNALLLSGGDVSKTLDFLEDEEANAVISKFINLQKGLASKRNSSAIHKEFESLTKEKEIFGKFLDFLINRISSDDLSSQNNLIFLEQLLKSKKFFNRNVNPKLISNWLYLQNLKILD